MSKRHDSARRLYTQTTKFLSVFQSDLARVQMPWMMVFVLRMRAICSYFGAAPDLLKLKRLRAALDTSAAAIASEGATKEAGPKKSASASSLQISKLSDVTALTPPLTPASPIATAVVATPTNITSPLLIPASPATPAAAAPTAAAAATLSSADCRDLVSLLRELESVQESRDLWRSAMSIESKSLSDARGKKSTTAILDADLAMLASADQLNGEHLESNTADAMIRYLKRVVPVANRIYDIAPFVRDDATNFSLEQGANR